MKSVFGPKVLLLAAFTCLILLVGFSGAAFAAARTTIASVDSSGVQGNNDSGVGLLWGDRPSISSDGRYVTFASYASNLVAGDTNGFADIFVHDNQTGITTRISVSSSGEQADSYSEFASISADGRYVAFVSKATNLVAGGDCNGCERIFVHDMQTGTTIRISVDDVPEIHGFYANFYECVTPSISADGRYVAFALPIFGYNSQLIDKQIYRHDMQTGSNAIVSRYTPEINGDNASEAPSISADGRYIAFASYADNLLEGDKNGYWDVFVRDMQTGIMTLVSVDSMGIQGDQDSGQPSISADGRYVAFTSRANNLVPDDTINTDDVFIHDIQTGTTTCVSVDASGKPCGDKVPRSPSISADGRYVAFVAISAIIWDFAQNTEGNVFVRDTQLGLTTPVSIYSFGLMGNNFSTCPAISADGNYVAFYSLADNLVPGDINTYEDVFVRDWKMGMIKVSMAPPYITGYCAWRLDGGPWFSAEYIVTGVPEGRRVIEFRPVTDWIQPATHTIDIQTDVLTEVIGQYTQIGTLNVTITPGAATNAGALWSIDGVNWYTSDTTLRDILVGQYTVSFKSLDLWNTPASQTVTVRDKIVTYVTGVYTPKPGSLCVTLSPQAAVDGGARWRVDGGAWQASGDTVSGIPIGQHTVSFLSPNGYNTMPDKVVNIYSCQTTTASAKYILSPSLKVLISPQAAINAGAKWRVDSSPWQSSGASLTDLAPGPHSITFNTVANWTPPCRQIVYLTEGHPSTTTGIYTVPSTIRALRVTIEPQAAAAAGARWRVDSSPWQTSGTTLTGLSVGQHTVKFNIIPGWVTPLNKTVAISSGTTACTTGVYATIQPTGALNVTALPQAVIGKAYWRVFDGAFETPWRAAGTGPINVPAGEHTVFFSDLAGFVTPASQTVTVIAGQTLNLTGTYTIAPTTTGTLTVSLARPMAMGAQARWRVYDGPSGYSSNWLYMGARLLKVPTGQHTVVFKPVPGWVTPNDQTVTITVGQDTKATATYTR